MQARKHIFPDEFASCNHVIRAKKANRLCFICFRREGKARFGMPPIMHSGTVYPFQLSPQCGENLIVGERVRSTETMDVVEVSGSRALEKPQSGENAHWIQRLRDSSSSRKSYNPICLIPVSSNHDFALVLLTMICWNESRTARSGRFSCLSLSASEMFSADWT